MNFLYFYRVTVDYKPLWSEFGHIKIRGEKIVTFLCGIEKKHFTYILESNALSGRELCPKCVQERNRLVDGQPTMEQARTWWQGGQIAHKKEMKELNNLFI